MIPQALECGFVEDLNGNYAPSVNGNTSANTWASSWTQISSGVAHHLDLLGISLQFPNAPSGDVQWAVDIGMDSAGGTSYTRIIPEIMHYTPASFRGGRNIIVPCQIPEGASVAARARQDTSGFSTPKIRVGIHGMHLNYSKPYHHVHSYGTTIDGSNTTTAQIDPGGTANTKGSWNTITPVGGIDHVARWIVVNIYLDNATTSNAIWSLDIARGSGINPSIVVGNLTFSNVAAYDYALPPTFCLPIPPIPVGEPIRARAQCSITDATDRLFRLQVLGAG